MAVTGYDKYDLQRTLLPTPALVPHESLAQELEETPSLVGQLQASITDHEWSATYTNHPVARASEPGEVVWPMALYLDGVPFTKRGDLLGLWTYNFQEGGTCAWC